MSEDTTLIALSTLFEDGASVRGKIPVPVIKALKAKGGDLLAFERRTDGSVVVRKSTAAERKAGGGSGRKGSRKK
jgi:bifunctional DNA-binding transcriptional regulator/antitoxin component of YhaV-PrlF toxin-antitoxin module